MKIRYLVYGLIGLFFSCILICLCLVRHHKPSFVVGRALMVANVARCLMQQKDSLLDGTVTKKRIFFDYCALEEHSLLDKQGNSSQVKETLFLGYKLHFFTYNALLSLLREIFVHQEYGIRLTEESPIIIDCGGNIGVSALFFKLAYPSSQLTVFEPDETNFALLVDNMQRNNLKGVSLVNKAVANREGTVQFNRVSTLCAKLDPEGVTQVHAVRLSSYIDRHVDLLKMDIEGAEVEVLQDLAENKKLSLIRNIIFEFHYAINNPNNLGEVLSLLEQAGFFYQIATSREWRMAFDNARNQPVADRCLIIYAYRGLR